MGEHTASALAMREELGGVRCGLLQLLTSEPPFCFLLAPWAASPFFLLLPASSPELSSIDSASFFFSRFRFESERSLAAGCMSAKDDMVNANVAVARTRRWASLISLEFLHQVAHLAFSFFESDVLASSSQNRFMIASPRR